MEPEQDQHKGPSEVKKSIELKDHSNKTFEQ
jgi:hypothetical protein